MRPKNVANIDRLYRLDISFTICMILFLIEFINHLRITNINVFLWISWQYVNLHFMFKVQSGCMQVRSGQF